MSGLIMVFGLAVTFATVFLILDPGVLKSFGTVPGWFNAFLIVLLVGRWIALYAMWSFKRWGVFLLLLLECAELSYGLFIFTGVLTLPVRLLALLLFLVILAVWFLAIRPKWRLFT